MNTKPNLQCHGNNVLEYVVGDFLEVKGSLGEKGSLFLRNYLYSQSIKESQITAVEGFYVGGQLILLDKVNPRYFRHIVCVAPVDGNIQVRRLF